MDVHSKNRYLAAASISLITLIAFSPTLKNSFVNWDDNYYVYNNVHLSLPFGDMFRWAFSSFYQANWHPLTWISHALDRTLWGLAPMGHHLTNNILHALNAFIVVLVSVRIIAIAVSQRRGSQGERPFLDEKGILTGAVITGLLFAIHPIHVESAAWISERKDLLSGFFFLTSILFYLKYAAAGRRGLLNNNYFAAFGLFILALMSKPMAITLPGVLLILDWYPLQRIRFCGLVSIIKEKIPFFVLSAASAAVTVYAEGSQNYIVPLSATPFHARLAVAANAIVSYLMKMILPVGLSPFYPYPESPISLLSLKYLLPAVLTIAVSAGCIVAARRQRLWLAAWAYYLLSLAPVIGLIRVGMQSMADRYTYLPSLGPFLVIGIGTACIAQKTIFSNKSFPVRAAVISFFVCLAATLSLLTARQISIWKNSITLWSYVIEKETGKIPFAHNNRGMAYEDEKEYKLAITDLSTAISLRPDYVMALNNRGLAFTQMGVFDKAIEDFSRAISISPRYSDAIYNRGVAYQARGLNSNAIEDFTRAIELDPANYEAYNNRGIAYGQEGVFGKALDDFNRAVELNPKYYTSYMNQGYAYGMLGSYDRAVESYTRAIYLRGKTTAAYIGRGGIYIKAGDKKRALSDFEKACGLGSEKGCKAAEELSSNAP